jgi:hypothetical protein
MFEDGFLWCIFLPVIGALALPAVEDVFAIASLVIAPSGMAPFDIGLAGMVVLGMPSVDAGGVIGLLAIPPFDCASAGMAPTVITAANSA